EIRVVRPEETEGLGIQEDRDLVSLITCTPYGINTHRLIVTGERMEEKE
ncbi:MAG: sortase, partial [Tyzzerella sp.]|nr:sortase [Tyzzerella sp.]